MKAEFNAIESKGCSTQKNVYQRRVKKEKEGKRKKSVVVVVEDKGRRRRRKPVRGGGPRRHARQEITATADRRLLLLRQLSISQHLPSLDASHVHFHSFGHCLMIFEMGS